MSLQQDSLLASPIILDLVILTELCQRVTIRPEGEEDFQSFHSVLALLSFLCKAPLVPSGTPVINAFFRQRACIENIMRYGQGCGLNYPKGGNIQIKGELWLTGIKILVFHQWEKFKSVSVVSFRACLGLPPQNHMMLEHKLQRDFLPAPTTYTNGKVTSLEKVALTNGKHIPLTNGFGAHVDDAAHAI